MYNLALRSARVLLVCCALGVFTPSVSATNAGSTTTVQGPAGLTVSITSTGSYNVNTLDPAWQIGGDLGVAPLNTTVTSGSDEVGPYTQIDFDYTVDAARHGAIRSYSEQNCVLFTVTYTGSGVNGSPFPAFTRYPSHMQHETFAGSFAIPSFPGFGAQSPWTFFDADRNTFIVSPASHFLVSWMTMGPQNAIQSGLSPQITSLPQGCRHSTLLTIGKGINRTYDVWGAAMTGLHKKKRPANDADVSLEKIGYWTDNGGYYYYHTEPNTSYQDTLKAVKANFDQLGIGLGYLQLDSWFYPKGPQQSWAAGGDGIYLYKGADTLFQPDLATFQRGLGVPLIAHARWIDSSSPYRQQYLISGNVSIDPLYWSDISNFLTDSGIAVYEQDWLGDKAQTSLNLTDPDAFLDNMAAATAHNGITMQYCMPTPSHLLQSTRYPNLLTARASEDRFDRNRWNNFIFTSRLLTSLDVYPFSDVFMSTESDNLLLAVLSAGPIGIGDRAGTINGANLLLAVRPDGVIVKPDLPLLPVDASYNNRVAAKDDPVVATTYTDHGALRTHYVFAYDQGSGTYPALTYADLGISGPAFAYDYFAGQGKVVHPGDSFQPAANSGRTFLILAPIGRTGIALLGDLGHYASMGKKRVSAASVDGSTKLTVAFAHGEASRTIAGYSAGPIRAVSHKGTISGLTYDPATHRFSLVAAPGRDDSATIEIAALR